MPKLNIAYILLPNLNIAHIKLPKLNIAHNIELPQLNIAHIELPNLNIELTNLNTELPKLNIIYILLPKPTLPISITQIQHCQYYISVLKLKIDNLDTFKIYGRYEKKKYPMLAQMKKMSLF